jgi:class I lanthipeptide synthase
VKFPVEDGQRTDERSGPGGVASWRSVLDPDRRAAAVAVAREVAGRASDPARIAAALAAAGGQTSYPDSVRWLPYGVAQGDAGLALLCASLQACLPGEGWDRVAHGFLTAAAVAVERHRLLPPSLFGGLSGLAFTADELSEHGIRYQRLLASLDEALAPQAAALGQGLASASAPGPVSDFDVIAGASGIGAYLLRRDPHGVLPEVLGGLVALAEPREGPPRWMTPPQLLGDASMVRQYPAGNLNCGLAHGIPGPLALLALASRQGVGVPGQAEAVRRLADWLVGHRADDRWGVNWPTAVPVAPPGEPDVDPARLPPSRSAWCYGSPGVARALWLAGDALDDTGLRELAVQAMLAVFRRPVPERRIESPTFCHGVAGLLQVVVRFAHDTGLSAFSAAAADLVDELLGAYRPERPLGFASLEPGANVVDRAGLLDGAPGVAMALFAAATATEPAWDRLFLLS